MTFTCLIGLIFVGLCVITVAQESTFKIGKLNLILEKAEKTLGPSKLKDLKSALARQEKDEIDLKVLKAHNQDKDGLFEAATRKKLLTILAKYSLDKYYDDLHPPIQNEPHSKRDNIEKSASKNSDTKANSKSIFRDKKLDKLWKKAEQSGFDQEQLMILQEEFQHQQDKLDEHYEIMDQLQRKVEQNSMKDKSENSLERDEREFKKYSKQPRIKETSEEKKARLELNIHQGLKEKYSVIKRNIDQLQKKIASGKVDDSQGPFEEEAVNKLWKGAISANFSSEDLDSFKEELKHYEVRIKKLKHFQNQLERDEIASKGSSSHSDESYDAKHIKKRVKELTHKVDKTQKSLEDRIERLRVEL